MSQNPRDEQALEDFLGNRDSLSRRYREASTEQPSAEADRAILAAAHRAAGARPQSAVRRRWAARWSAPLATAAVVVLAVAVTVMLEREPEVVDLGETSRQKSPAPAAEPAAKADKLAPQAVAPAAKQRSAPAREISEERKALTDNAVPQPPKAPAAEKETVVAGAANIAAETPAQSDELAKSEAAPRAATALSAQRREAATRADGAIAQEPRAQLREIEDLYRAGRTEAADRALTAFCRDHPDHRLNDALANQARRLRLPCAAPG